eukprot:13525212-Ditylum_brightwellii.AAC.1
MDMVYTLLCVPSQTQETAVSFFIQVTNKRNLWFKMMSGFHILFSAHVLTHHQKCHNHVVDRNVNIGAYTSRNLFHNFAKTYERLTRDDHVLDEHSTKLADSTSSCNSASSSDSITSADTPR